MASQFDDLFAGAALGVLQDQLAESIKHNPDGAIQTTIDAIVRRQQDLGSEDYQDGEQIVHRATISIDAAITVSDKDSFELDGDGKKWGVQGGVKRKTGRQHVIELVLYEPREKSAQSYRIQR